MSELLAKSSESSDASSFQTFQKNFSDGLHSKLTDHARSSVAGNLDTANAAMTKQLTANDTTKKALNAIAKYCESDILNPSNQPKKHFRERGLPTVAFPTQFHRFGICG